MTEDTERELDEFRRLREQVTDARRDELIRKAYAEGGNINQIHVRMGVSRSTVYRTLGLAPISADGGQR